MIGWLKFLLVLNKALSAIREFLIYLRAKAEGRQEQADKQAKHDDETVKRGRDARAEFERGGLRDVAKKYHVDD
jgi:hypothetical protein